MIYRTLLIGMIIAHPALAKDLTVTETTPRPVISEQISLVPAASTSFIGVVDAHVKIDLGFPVIGTIAERPVDVGDLVARGQVLARLDPQDLDADLRAAEAGVSVATAQLKSAKDARTRAQQLLDRGVDSKTRVESAERSLKAAEANVEQARAALARAQDVRGYADLVAPQDGLITQVYAEPGASLSTGDPVVRLVGTKEREVVIDVTERDLVSLGASSSFDAVLIANPDVKTRVTLSRIDPVANRSTRTRRARLALGDAPAGFRLGALVRLLPSSGVKAGISLPKSAILEVDGDTPSVWVVDRETNSVSQIKITLGAEFGPYIRIQDGLNVGDEVILKGIHSLQEGQVVGPQVTQ